MENDNQPCYLNTNKTIIHEQDQTFIEIEKKSISAKNKLQEYCQKNKLPMPIYNAWSIGESHKLEWSASVSIILDQQCQENIIANTIMTANTKTNAEKQAAAILLEQLLNNQTILDKSCKNSIKNPNINNEDPTNYLVNLTSIKKIYIIDLENKPLFKCEFKDDAIYVGFLNSIHHSISKYISWHKCQSDDIYQEIIESKCNKLIYLIEGGNIDLVDHFMTVMIYPLLKFIDKNNISPEIIIISGDHAGWCTRRCMEKILEWKKISLKIDNAAFI